MGVAENMLQNFKYYEGLKGMVESRDMYRIAYMDNASYRAEKDALSELARGLSNAKQYITGEVRANNQHDTYLFNLYVQYARQGLGLENASDEELVSAIDATVQDINSLLGQLDNLRFSYFKYGDGSDPNDKIVDRRAAENYLEQYVGLLGGTAMQEYMNKLYTNPDVGERGREELDTMIRCAVLLRGKQTKDGSIKDRVDVGGIGLSPVERVADKIIKWAFNDGKWFFSSPTRASLNRGLEKDARNFAVGTNAMIGNALGHLQEGTDFSASGLSVKQAAQAALSLDFNIWNAMRDLIGRTSRPREFEEAVNSENQEKIQELANFLPIDTDTALRKVQQVLEWRAQAKTLAASVNTMTNNQYGEFLFYYLGDENSSVYPEWEPESALAPAKQLAASWKGGQDIGSWAAQEWQRNAALFGDWGFPLMQQYCTNINGAYSNGGSNNGGR